MPSILIENIIVKTPGELIQVKGSREMGRNTRSHCSKSKSWVWRVENTLFSVSNTLTGDFAYDILNVSFEELIKAVVNIF